MMRGQIPPQGYAKDVLIQAYNWIMSQPESVKSQATTADALVVLYNRARRGGSDAPVSSEKFRNELKDIASELKNFSDPEDQRTAPPVNGEPVALRTAPAAAPRAPEGHMAHSVHGDGPIVRNAIHPDAERASSRHAPLEYQRGPSRPTFIDDALNDRPVLSLDSRTLEVLQKTRAHLNLSSDSEALRMLVVLGFERVQNLFR
ncbi:MAG TPA: hypothetical protein VFV50_19300 [Bdellovibrionales bacterium]|nr:hypothetical protein [Bdellovibrionales bacterium]